MTTTASDGNVESFLDLGIAGRQREAVRLVIDLLDAGMPATAVIEQVLRPAQHVVGERWQRGEWTTADEHLVTGATQAALEALATTATPAETDGLVVVVCAEGDWHALPGQMFAESLRARGQGVSFLGASVPVDDIAAFIAQRRPDALAVTCNLALSYLGTARVVDACHRLEVPVLAGGRALTADRARRLGADGWAPDVQAAADLLRAWRDRPPVVDVRSVRLDPGALELHRQAASLSELAFERLEELFPTLADYDQRQRAHTRQDLAYIVQFLAAARLVDDDEVFTTFHQWLESLLRARGVPPSAIAAGLHAIAPLVAGIDEGAHRLATAAESQITQRAGPTGSR